MFGTGGGAGGTQTLSLLLNFFAAKNFKNLITFIPSSSGPLRASFCNRQLESDGRSRRYSNFENAHTLTMLTLNIILSITDLVGKLALFALWY